MKTYLDTSVVFPLFVPETLSRRTETFIAELAPPPAVSDFAAAEFVAALSTAVRARRITEGAAQERLSDFDLWRATAVLPAAIGPEDMEQAEGYVRRFDLKLRAPDALHVAMAQRIGATLVTLDRRLADAAGTLGIAVVVPGAGSPKTD